jgi:hypothetical protein
MNKLLLILFVLVGLSPARADLSETYRTQQEVQRQRDERRAELCENHLRQAQFKQIHKPWGQSWDVYYRVSRGDLYKIAWYGYQNNGPLEPKPCAVELLPLNEDYHPMGLGGQRVRGTYRFVVEGNELVRYNNSLSLSFNPDNPNPSVVREVMAVRFK